MQDCRAHLRWAQTALLLTCWEVSSLVWQKPVSGRGQWVSEQECACLSAAPCTNRVGALYETILCPGITVLQMNTFNMMCVTVLGLSNKTLKKIVTCMLQKISETDMPSIKFQDHVS